MAEVVSNKKVRKGGRFRFEWSMLPGFLAFLIISTNAILDILIADNPRSQILVYSYLTPYQKFLRYMDQFPYFNPIAFALVIIGGILLFVKTRSWDTRHKRARYIGFVLFTLTSVVFFLPNIIHSLFPHDFTFGGYVFSGATYIADYNLTMELPAIMALFILVTAFLGTSLLLQSVGIRLRKVLSYIATAVMFATTLYAWIYPYSFGFVIDAFHPPKTTVLTMIVGFLNAGINNFVLSLGRYLSSHPFPDFNFAYVFIAALMLLSASLFPIMKKDKRTQQVQA